MEDIKINSEHFDLIANGSSENKTYCNEALVPSFPPDEVQKRTTGRAGVETLKEAFLYYEDCLSLFNEYNKVDFEKSVLLDFGVGWGRILRFFMKDISTKNLIGVDIKKELLDICNSTFDWGTFVKSESHPPLPLEDASVDFITGYSVFSHLSEDASRAWLEEFHRILKPGGMVTVTTRGRWFLNYIRKLDNNTSYKQALNQCFNDFEEVMDQYDAGHFIHASGNGISGSGELNESFYGETWIPESYAKKNYSDLYTVYDYDFTQGRSSHPIMVFQKK